MHFHLFQEGLNRFEPMDKSSHIYPIRTCRLSTNYDLLQSQQLIAYLAPYAYDVTACK